MKATSRKGSARQGGRRRRPPTGGGEGDSRGREASEEAPRPAIEPEPGVELNVGEDPGGVPDPEWK